jgi:cyclopropane fatty-acyl-phospholipid synthase-like methyltransferase
MDKSYWNNFYASDSNNLSIALPSQFCLFALGETSGIKNIIDFGTGNGRDAFYFAQNGKRVLALDASISAIEENTELAKKRDLHSFVSFQRFEVGTDQPEDINIFDEPKSIYARFFLHSLTNSLLEEFAEVSSNLLSKGEILLVEYRNSKDESRQKVFDGHFRNYIDQEKLCILFNKFGLKKTYGVDGLGYAKYKDDDAYVSRNIFQKK